MNKTELGELPIKEALLDNAKNEKQISSVNSFTPKYLSLHGITEASQRSEINPEPSTTYRDVALVSAEGDAFLCNKLFLIR